MKMPWSREAVRILPTKIDLTGQPWYRNALLLHVRGNGALRWETRALPPEADYYESARCLTLRSTPLLSGHFAAWETSESRLCTGWGLDTAECPELDALRETLNGGFARLEDAASIYPTTKNYVFTHSSSLPQKGFIPVSGDAAEFVKKLGPDKNIWIIGGNTILAPLLERDMVDHLIVQVAPVLLGEGIPLFTQKEGTMRFRLDEVRRYGQFAELIYSRNAPRG